MTLAFMVLGAPRSATTWCAAWLTTDTTLCLHDPLFAQHYADLDAIESDKVLGIACTGCALFPDWVNRHSARKVILHRDLKEVDASLARIGMPPCSAQWEGVLERIEGIHLPWTDVFDRPKHLYEYLLNLPFDAERHAQLRDMNVQPAFGRISVDRTATMRLIKEFESARAC